MTASTIRLVIEPPMPASGAGTAGAGAIARHALVLAAGDIAQRATLDAAWPGWADGVDLVIAADGGYLHARSLHLAPDLLVGDLDSLPVDAAEAAWASGMPVLRSRTDKDESDTELAVLEAVARGADRITVLGAFGGPRLDHAIANLWLLADRRLAGVRVVMLDASTRASLIGAPGPDGGPVTRLLPGRPDGLVSLLPLGGDVEGITTAGLRYALVGEPLIVGPARGISNVRVDVDAAVTVGRGRLLVVETAPDPVGAPDPVETARTDGGLSSPA